MLKKYFISSGQAVQVTCLSANINMTVARSWKARLNHWLATFIIEPALHTSDSLDVRVSSDTCSSRSATCYTLEESSCSGTSHYDLLFLIGTVGLRSRMNNKRTHEQIFTNYIAWNETRKHQKYITLFRKHRRPYYAVKWWWWWW
jgi:hypothetical protein